MNQLKEGVAKLLKKALEELEEKIIIKEENILKMIEVPPSAEMGDYSFPCFFLAERLKQEPNEIALSIREKISTSSEFDDIQTQGAYVNFFVNRKEFTINQIKEILSKKEKFGKNDLGKINRTMVEFPSPNTNKPLHLGHLRNMSIGESLSRILEFSGEKVIRANLYNDRGIHISQSMLAYQKLGKNKQPEKKKPDHFVGEFYVLFHKKAKHSKVWERESHEMLRKWEEKDKKTIALWKKMNKWALSGFKETYRKFDIEFDKEYFESEIYTSGKKIIEYAIKKGILKKEKDGAVSIDLKKEKLGKKYLIRADGTSLYMIQDIHLAIQKIKDFKLNKSIYVTGSEQEYHFKVLFLLLKKLGLNIERMKHFSYGMVNLPGGKMKSREGEVVDADNIIDKVKELVVNELKKREKLSKQEIESRSLIITRSAIKYMLLRTDIKKNILFNPKESVSFEGDTGPYLLYSYARANSILKKAKEAELEREVGEENKKMLEIEQLELKEIELIKKLSQFPEIVSNSYINSNPSLIANYSHQLAQIFNEFYHSCPVIGSNQEVFRLKLVEAFKQVLKNSLNLLGIKVLERM